MRLAREPSLAILNQNWHTFLAADLNVLANGQSKSADRFQTTLDLIVPQSGTYSRVKLRNASKDPLVVSSLGQVRVPI